MEHKHKAQIMDKTLKIEESKNKEEDLNNIKTKTTKIRAHKNAQKVVKN